MRNALKYLQVFEPARLKALYIAVLTLVTVLGFTVPTDVDSKVTAVLALIAVVFPFLQGELTRKDVTPLEVAKSIAAKALFTPVPAEAGQRVEDLMGGANVITDELNKAANAKSDLVTASVAVVEHALMDAGYLDGALANGIWDAATSGAYTQFQEYLDVPVVDGIPKPEELEYLGLHSGFHVDAAD